MTKFILIVFGFLGFAFYELSGGADFDGEKLRLSRVDPAPVLESPAEVRVAIEDQSDADTLEVTRASFNVISVDTQETIETAAVPIRTNEAEFTQASLISDVEEKPASVLILPSLIAQPEAVEALEDSPVVATQSTLDIRSVTSNRVNVRGGPSTDFEIVGKLTRGAEVEILSDNGNGWVEMQSIDGTASGWMADFLLSDG